MRKLDYLLCKSLKTLQANTVYRVTRQFSSAASERNVLKKNAMYMYGNIETRSRYRCYGGKQYALHILSVCF